MSRNIPHPIWNDPDISSMVPVKLPDNVTLKEATERLGLNDPKFEEYAKKRINDLFGVVKEEPLEAVLTIAYSAHFDSDSACLTIASNIDGSLVVRNSFYGKEATNMYFKLVGQEA